MSITLTVMVILWLFAYVQTLTLKHVQSFVYQLHLSKVIFRVKFR